LSIERKVKLAEDQIKASEASVIKDIKDKAVDQSILLAEATLLKTAKTKM
jgi:F0F1-type ATP synthase membrane subunit b/b'